MPSRFQIWISRQLGKLIRHKSLRQTSEFGEQALEPLADGIRRGSVEVREFLSVGSVQFEINQEI